MKRHFGESGPSPGKTSIVRDVYSPGRSHRNLQRFQPALNCFQTVPPVGVTANELRSIKADNQSAVRNARAKVIRDLRSDEEKAHQSAVRNVTAKVSRDLRSDEDKASALAARRTARALHAEENVDEDRVRDLK